MGVPHSQKDCPEYNDRFGCHVYVVSGLYCGVCHNSDLNLSGTENKYTNSLRPNEIVLLARLLITIHQIF